MLGRRLPLLLAAVLLLGSLTECSKRTRQARVKTHSRRQAQSVDDVGQDLQITIYPTQLEARDGREATFDCRARTADNSVYPPVRWTRVGGPMPPTAHESTGRLTISPVSLSDSGRYVCTTVHNGRTEEASATLNVLSFGPQELQGSLPSSGQCAADERQCANNECVKSQFVCDGEPDCRDRSDEQNCGAPRQCEPNEHRCNNGRCVMMMWKCDGENDCGDGSDELNCGESRAGDVCKKTEFKCHDGRQCVPSSFHCDGTNDCKDGSDEVGCVQPTVVDIPPPHMDVGRGDTFQLKCKAVAVPEPYINWRLNWGPVCEPPRCVQTSEGGVGVLTVSDAQPLDQGAYTCEAINVKGRVLATPDCIVRIVGEPSPQPPTRQPSIRCDNRGAVSPAPNPYGQCECKPQVTGPSCDQCRPGSFHLSEKAPEGCIKCFCFGVTNQCQSSNLYRTKEELLFAGEAEGVTISDIEELNIDRNPPFEYTKPGFLTLNEACHDKYWRLPQRFLGNKVTAYGGKMEFEVEYHGSGAFTVDPMVVLKGNQVILAHRVKNENRVLQAGRPNKIVIETYENNWERLNGVPATREDLMMVLADLDAFLIRAQHVTDQYSTSLGRVSWEVATERVTSGGRALEVEQCSCPPGYMGTSCEDCAPGYERSGSGPYLGTCVPVQQQIRTPPPATCNAAGAVTPYAYGGRCQCKEYTTGPNCDQCAPESFHMSPQNPEGCLPCFCMGITKQCQSSNYQRTTVGIDYPRGDREEISLTTSDIRSPYTPRDKPSVTGSEIRFASFAESQGQTLYWKLPEKFLGNKVTAYGGTLKYVFKFDGYGSPNTDADVIIRGNDLQFQHIHRQSLRPNAENAVEIKLYESSWQRPDGANATRPHLLMALADIDTILIKATYNTDSNGASSLISASLEYAEPYGGHGVTALEVEQCMCPPGYVGTSCEDCAPGYSRTGGGLYLGLCAKCECHGHASQCDKEYGFCVDCQHNTEGDQCERCKPGFVGDARRGTPSDCQAAVTKPACQCNNHSPRGCDSFGRCSLCEHNTEGVHCERCKKGFYGDATKGTPFDCTPCPCPGASDCFLDDQGLVNCRNCPPGLSGRLCNECAPGYTRNTKSDGRQCVPIGEVDDGKIIFVPQHEGDKSPAPQVDPNYQKVNEGEPAQFRCWVPGIPDCQIRWHKEYVGGSLPEGVYQTGNALKVPYAQMHHGGNYVCTAETLQYGITKSPDAKLEVIRPLPNTPPPRTSSRRCDTRRPATPPPAPMMITQAPTQPPPIPDCEEVPVPPPPPPPPRNCGPRPTATPRPPSPIQDRCATPLRIRVDPPQQTVRPGDPARFRCWVPNRTDMQLKWTRPGGAPLPSGVMENQGILSIPRTTEAETGNYVCQTHDPLTNRLVISEPVTLSLIEGPTPPTPIDGPIVDPPRQTVEEGTPAQFRCYVPSNPHALISWARADGQPLPSDAVIRDGFIKLPSARLTDAGHYICTASDPHNRTPPRNAEPAILNVIQSKEPRGPMTLEVDPPMQTVDAGQPATVRCFSPDQPRAQLRWMRNQRDPLPRGAQERDGVLTIHNMQPGDAGTYTCTGYNPDGGPPAQVPAEIRVREPARPVTVVVEPIEQTVPEGSPFFIRCYVPGYPQLKLTWRKEDGDLPEDSIEQNNALRVAKSRKEDEGEYVCTAKDPSTGEPVDSQPATVHVTPTGPPPVTAIMERPEIVPEEQTVTEHDRSTMRCWVPGKPNARLTYRRVGTRDGALPVGTTVEQGQLTISDTLMGDAGLYVCLYHPDVPGARPIESKHSRLIVQKPQGEPPQPVATPPLITVPTGEPARFHCDAHSDTPAEIKWGFEEADGPLRGDVSQDGDDLVIHSATDEVVGEYVCSATNEFGSGVAEPVRLAISDTEEPPTARVEPRVWNGRRGDKHKFKCHVTGIPTPSVTWTGPNGSPLAHDVTPLDGNILDFADGRPELNGDYTCTAKNSVGEAADHGVVNIGPSIDVKVTPAGPRIVITVGEPLEVKCEAFGDPEPGVEWLHDPGPERGDLPDDYVSVTISEQFLRHPAIGLGNAGTYTCKGSNSHATATKNIYIEVVEPSKVATVAILGGHIQFFDQGEPGELTCTATGGSLVDRLEWIKVDDQLPLDVEDHNEPGVLHFPAFKPSYSGKYECRGYRKDEEIASASVNVYGTNEDIEEARVDIDPPRMRVVQQGDAIVMQCSVSGAKASEHFEWALLRSGALIRRIGSEPKLTINKADPTNDFGVYRCNVENENGIVMGSAYSAVTIGYGSEKNAQEVKFDLNTDASFTCPVYSVPGAKVEWSRRDGDLPASALPIGNKLEIKDFDDSTTGLYVCRVVVDNQAVEGYVDAKVFVPDTIIQVLLEVSSENVSAGERAWFDCKVTGDPNAVISWSREGADSLPKNSQVTGSRLQFTDLIEEDGGTYKCSAKTKAGPLETRTVLNVGAAKRKRKHAPRRGRHTRHQRRRAAAASRHHRGGGAEHGLFGNVFRD